MEKIENKYTESTIIFLIVALGFITRWYHSFGVNSISYGSGDAFGVVLKSLTLEQDKVGYYMMSYLYRIFHDVTQINYWNLTFYLTPIISIVLVLMIYKIVKDKINLWAAVFASLFILTNPWISFYSTEPSKAIFVILFFILSLSFLFRFQEDKKEKYIIWSFIFFSFGAIFFHSMFLFLPFYVLTLIYLFFDKKQIKFSLLKVLQLSAIFLLVFTSIAGPYYAYQVYDIRTQQAKKPKLLKTEADTYGNFFERQIRAMWAALTKHPEKLGYNPLKKGVENFLLDNLTLKYLILSFFILSIFLFHKNKIYLYFSLLTLYIFSIISIQWVASSHGSRYPQYIIFFIYICLGSLFSFFLAKIRNTRAKIIFLSLSVLFIFFTAQPFKYVEGLRHTYIPHIEIGTLAKESKININQNNQVLYLAWPGITLSMMENFGLIDEKYFHTFGWGNVNLDGISSVSYIRDNSIRYYIYDQTGTDYFDSSKKVFKKLEENFTLTFIAKTKRPDLYCAIYEIKEK